MSMGNTIETMPDNSSCSVNVEGRNLLLVKRHGELFLYANHCPHTGESLDPMGGSIASAEGLLLTCQRHAAQFISDTGECVGGPCLGESIEAVAFTYSGGELYLD